MCKEFIAYEGDQFTIEWYFDKSGNCPVLKFFNSIDARHQQKLFYLFRRMGDFGRISDLTKFVNEGDGIWAFKPQPFRFLSFFMKGRKIIITNGFIKKSQKIPKDEKELAIKKMKDYTRRVQEGSYYENE